METFLAGFQNLGSSIPIHSLSFECGDSARHTHTKKLEFRLHIYPHSIPLDFSDFVITLLISICAKYLIVELSLHNKWTPHHEVSNHCIRAALG